MAKRDPRFREKVLKLDDYCCQICGFDGHDEEDLLEADHVIPRAMGGIPSRDDPDNGMTLCVKCHKKKTDGHIVIEHWDRSDQENGLIAKTKSGAGIANDDLWFYKKKDKELLEKSIEASGVIAMSLAQKAKIMANLWKYYQLSDAKSPEQLAAQIGLDPNEAEDEAKTFIKLEKFGLHWPDGVNLSKAKLVAKCLDSFDGEITLDLLKSVQKLLGGAAHASYSDLELDLAAMQLSSAGKGGEIKKKFYLFIPRRVFVDKCRIYLADDEEIMEKETSDIKIRVGKFFYPLRKWGEKLLIENGLLEEKIKVRSAKE